MNINSPTLAAPTSLCTPSPLMSDLPAYSLIIKGPNDRRNQQQLRGERLRRQFLRENSEFKREGSCVWGLVRRS
jgi:hypothetical protein